MRRTVLVGLAFAACARPISVTIQRAARGATTAAQPVAPERPPPPVTCAPGEALSWVLESCPSPRRGWPWAASEEALEHLCAAGPSARADRFLAWIADHLFSGTDTERAFASALVLDGLEQPIGEPEPGEGEPEEERERLVACGTSVAESRGAPAACVRRLDRWLAAIVSGPCDRAPPAPPRLSPARSMLCAAADRVRCARGIALARELEVSGSPVAASVAFERLVFGPSAACPGRRDLGDLAVTTARAGGAPLRATSLFQRLEETLPRPLPVILRAPPWQLDLQWLHRRRLP